MPKRNDNPKNDRLRKTSTLKRGPSDTREDLKSERVSTSDRSKSNERTSRNTKERNQDQRCRADLPSRENNMRNKLAVSKKRNSQVSDDTDKGKRQSGRTDNGADKCSRPNRGSWGEESFPTNRSRGSERASGRHESIVYDRRRSDRVRESGRDRVNKERSKTPTSDDIKAILRSVSVKIASEIDNLTSRSKDRSRKEGEVKGQLQRSERSKPAPWGCKDLREGGYV